MAAVIVHQIVIPSSFNNVPRMATLSAATAVVWMVLNSPANLEHQVTEDHDPHGHADDQRADPHGRDY